jgi:acyl dehydratase
VLAAEVDLEVTAEGPPPAGSRSRAGEEITSAVVTEERAVAAWCAAVGDDNPLHHDGAAARAAGLDGPIVPGWLTLGLALEAARRAGLLPPAGTPVEVASRFSRPVPVGADLALSVAPGRPDGVVLAARSAAGPALRGAWAAPAGPAAGH